MQRYWDIKIQITWIQIVGLNKDIDVDIDMDIDIEITILIGIEIERQRDRDIEIYRSIDTQMYDYIYIYINVYTYGERDNHINSPLVDNLQDPLEKRMVERGQVKTAAE